MTEPDSDLDGFFSTARTTGREGAVELPHESYLGYLFDPDDPKFSDFRHFSYDEFAADRKTSPFLQELLGVWEGLYREPFVGVTADGSVRQGVYPLGEPVAADPALLRAAEAVLALLSPDEAERFCHPIDAPEWRAWSNPEFVIHRVGLRLEDLSDDAVQAVLALVQASLSPEGYERVCEAMALNGFLGDLVGLPNIMNDRSYWVSLFGTPSNGEPWGWQLFGHHVALNFVVVDGVHTIAPVFIGAEPALSEGVRPPLFDGRERTAIRLASSFTPEQRAQAVTFASVLDPAMPEGRIHPADERHLAGAFRDNRVIPYEGVPAAALSDGQRALLREIAEDFLLLLTEPQRRAALERYDAHIDDTWFAWYGATDGSQPFYFRIQSPVILAELDHHAGVWLSNRLPARFHVHTTLRLPNGNDYGRAHLAQWHERHARS